MEHFYGSLHVHAELQLTYILKGQGTAYIGDRIEQFDSGDVFLLGPNLPHVFKDEWGGQKDGIESYSIFFLPDFFGEGFLKLPESRVIKQLIERSERGIKLVGFIKNQQANNIINIFEKTGLEKLVMLITMLEEIGQSDRFILLASNNFQKPRKNSDGKKINDVFDFLMKNYTRPINLKEVAETAHMSPSAFCRYFKQHTRKTYTQFLNEIRVGQACKLLSDKNRTISQVCYQTGYNNLSNFNRQFKGITGLSPRDYAKQQEFNA